MNSLLGLFHLVLPKTFLALVQHRQIFEHNGQQQHHHFGEYLLEFRQPMLQYRECILDTLPLMVYAQLPHTMPSLHK